MMTIATSTGRSFRALRIALAAGAALAAGTAAFAQQAYPTPTAAAEAFVDAVARHDGDALKTVIGRDYAKFVPHANAEDTTDFLAAWAKSRRIVASGDDKAYLEVGRNGWTLPIPLVRTAEGWRFDVRATPDELRTRRIGRNELAAIEAALAYVDAQEDYAKLDPDRDGRADYAQKLVSSHGRQDGLYWPTRPGERESPLGSQFTVTKPEEGYHGYHFRILNAQGKDAPSGAKSYLSGGGMTVGHALVAWPAKWGETGVMSFIVAKDGVVHQKDLGPATDRIARAMAAYNPDATWTRVPRPK